MGKDSRVTDVFLLEELKKLFPPERTKLFAIWKDLKHSAAYMTLATTGIRPGELLALQWLHLINNKGLFIERAVKPKTGLGPTKTEDVRVVLLPKCTVDLLLDWREESLFPDDDCLIFFGAGRHL